MGIEYEIEQALIGALDYVYGLRQKDGCYSLQLGREPTLLSTAFGALCERLLNGSAPKQTLKILYHSQTSHGCFRDRALRESEIESELHPYSYLLDQTTYFATRSLRLCDWPLLYRPTLSHTSFGDDLAPAEWLKSLDWKDPWLESNRVMFCLEAYRGRPQVQRALVDWLGSNTDPHTGFWGTDRGATLLRGMAGAFHFYGFLLEAQAYLPRPELAVASTLKLQHSDGLFFPSGGGNSCLDMDAIDILSMFYQPLRSKERRTVQSALENSLRAVLALQRPDGGFPESLSLEPRESALTEATNDPNSVCQTWSNAHLIRYSSWHRMEYDALTSDLWGTLSRAVCLVRIAQSLGLDTRADAWPIRTAGICQMLRLEV